LLAGITLFLAATGLAVHEVVEARLREGLDGTLEAVLRSSVNDVVREREREQDRRNRRGSPRSKSFLGWLLPEQEDVLLQAWASDGTTLFRSEALGDEQLPRVAQDLDPLPIGDLSGFEPYRVDVSLPGSGEQGRAMAFRYVTRERRESSSRVPSPGERRNGRRSPPPGFPPDALREGPDGGPDDLNAPGRGEPQVIELVVAHDTTGLDETMSELRWLLVLGWLVSSVGCAGIVSWIVLVGLRPLRRLRDQMGRRGGDELQRRFNLPDAPSELAPVVDQLNDLMGRIGGAFEREQAFASDVAHELRTPLAGLRATLELALSRPRENDSLRATAQQSLQITLEMETLVETLLDLARMSREAERPSKEVDLVGLLQSSWSAHAELAAARDLRLNTRLPEAVTMFTDSVLLARVLDNLVENAVSYATASSVVDVGLVVEDAPREASGSARVYCLTVSNEVEAAGPDLAQHAFEPFWRADSSRSETGRHAGLGLALCRRIVETLGGSLGAEVDGGRFIVTMRLVQH
jgi:signal transduction histidine kinase